MSMQPNKSFLKKVRGEIDSTFSTIMPVFLRYEIVSWLGFIAMQFLHTMKIFQGTIFLLEYLILAQSELRAQGGMNDKANKKWQAAKHLKYPQAYNYFLLFLSPRRCQDFGDFYPFLNNNKILLFKQT
jgi:hypothetical protein